MQLLSALALAGLASAASRPLRAAERRSHDILKAVVARQDDVCVPVPEPATCEDSCGPGNIMCISYPNCYNPGNGEVCCSDGKYCPAGTYCTDAGCCPDDVPLEQCGATTTLSVVPPPSADEPTEAPEPTDDAPEPTGDAPEPTGKPTKSEDCEEEPTPTPTSDCEEATSEDSHPKPTETEDCEEDEKPTDSYPEEPTYPSATASSNGTIPEEPSYPEEPEEPEESSSPEEPSGGNGTAPTSPPIAGSGRVELCTAAVAGALGVFMMAM